MTRITISQAVELFLLHCAARRLSENTIKTYSQTLNRLTTDLDNPQFAEITVDDIEAWLAEQTVSDTTLRKYHTAMSSLWTWATTTRRPPLAPDHIMHRIPAPTPESRVIDALSADEIRAMIKSLKRSRMYNRRGCTQSDHELKHQRRNRAMILLLYDTGMRVSELCGLSIADLDRRNRRVLVMGKGDKERDIPISARTLESIVDYLTIDREDARTDEPLFLSEQERPMERCALTSLLRNIGQRAGVDHVHAHRFRHSFAIAFLRNGGNVLELQRILGHSTMAMVKRYVRLAQVDLDKAHRRASPVDRARL